jgi:glycosyltransferase involved in cell wall biosynthesis
MDQRPKVTIITATHNRADLLPRAIKSVLAQSVKDFEYIIVADNCTDNTEEVVKSFGDPRIKLIINNENPAKTHCRPFNVGLKEAKGEYIAYLDDDNEFYSYHLEVLLSTIESAKLDLVYCDMMVVQPDGKMDRGIAMDFDPQFLMLRNYIDTSEIMHKRELAFSIGGWDEKVTRFTDWNFCVRATKWGAKIQHVPIVALKYYVGEEDTQSQRTPVRSYYDPTFQMTMFEPTFDPAGCYIHEKYLGIDEKETKPRVAIFTMTYGRLEYTKRMFASLKDSTDYPFDWYVFDQGSDDGTGDWLYEQKKETKQPRWIKLNGQNVGITKGSNALLDAIGDDYQIIIKTDNDCQFMTKKWLDTMVELWRRNHMLYMSPYPEGLVDNPGGAQRVGNSNIGPYYVEVTRHVGGLCAVIDARAYKNFRWTDQFKHGNQDSEASFAFREKGYMPCYIPMHRVWHIDGTSGQKEKYPDYFERRKVEKTEVA